MLLENGRWKVYDVVIEGVSLVMNYRSQFREILANKSPRGASANAPGKGGSGKGELEV
jgi:phospholipid transport system substrate-binding protein